ncbi:MAG: DNA-3-methyladenine glycosylase 2 family protein [Planctomycetota bacterium]|nr:MAG: DNA-3-methyladenine glycosylase 2 family protein [Planctomycetota bacterium]
MPRPSRAETHLAACDPVLAGWIEALGPCTLRRNRVRDPFVALVRAVVAQRVSGAAARTVNARLERLLGGPPSPAGLLALGPRRLRAAGLPERKAHAIHTLANRVRSGDLPLERIRRAPAPRVRAALTAIPGVGEWTANMFLLFHLARPDVFPARDLGVREGIRRGYGLASRPSAAEALRFSERWAPYRSTAAWYLWRSLGGEAMV